MSGKVPAIPPLLREYDTDGDTVSTVRVTHPVRGNGHFAPMADAINWCLGSGAILGWFGPRTVTAGSSVTLRTYAWPRANRHGRLWQVVVKNNGAFGVFGSYAVWTTQTIAADSDTETPVTLYFRESVATVTSAGEALSLTMQVAAAGSDLEILSATVSEYALPYVAQADAGAVDLFGVDRHTCMAERPIYSDGASVLDDFFTSAHGVAYASTLSVTSNETARRCALFNWSVDSPKTYTSSTFANIFQVDPFVQTRHLYAGDVYRSVGYAVYAKVTAGGSGQVRVTSSVTGATATYTFTSDTAAWQESSSIVVETDDPTDTDWLRDEETLTFEARATSGTLSVYAIAIGES